MPNICGMPSSPPTISESVRESSPSMTPATSHAHSRRCGTPVPSFSWRDVLFTSHRKQMVELAAENRLPVMYGIREFVDVGGLMTYGPDLRDQYRQAATYVDKILKGTKPADLPVQQPTKIEFLINVKTAQAIGLVIPAPILLRADQIIE